MPDFLLVRHGEPDWQLVEDRGFIGAAADLAILTPSGVEQARERARSLHAYQPTKIISSPMTRALQTGTILSSELGIPIVVEFDLREWLPHTGFSWKTSDDIAAAYQNMIGPGADPEPVEPYAWEPLQSVRERSLRVLETHCEDGPVVVVCHVVVIYALTGHAKTPFAGMRIFSLPVQRRR